MATVSSPLPKMLTEICLYPCVCLSVCVFTEVYLPLQAVCACTGVGSVSVSGDGDGLPGFPTQFTGGHTLSEVHRPILAADSKHLHAQNQQQRGDLNVSTSHYFTIKVNQQERGRYLMCYFLTALGGMWHYATETHLVVESYVDHDHFTHHVEPAGAAGVVGVHTASEPHLAEQEREEENVL